MHEWAEMNGEEVCNERSGHLTNTGQFLSIPVCATDGQLPRVLWKLPQGWIRGGPKVLAIRGFLPLLLTSLLPSGASVPPDLSWEVTGGEFQCTCFFGLSQHDSAERYWQQ